MPTAVVILAAGQGTRMKSELPKVVHPIAGQPMLAHAMQSAQSIGADRLIVVTGHGAAKVEQAARAIDPDVQFVRQAEQRGTGHAVDQARDALADFDGDVIVLFGDTPFIRTDTLEAILSARRDGADVVVLGFRAAVPGRYGRLVTDGGALHAIVEAKDASTDQLKIDLCNSGVKCADRSLMFDLISELDDQNAQGELYLTDIVEKACARDLKCVAIECDEAETLGINSRSDLAAAEAQFQARKRSELLAEGVTMTAPDTVFLSHDTVIGPDTLIEPNVVFGPGVTVENGATLRAFSHLEGCHISNGATIGPYARIRPGSEIGSEAKVGNFVETKAAVLAQGAKINHLSYVGDAEVGEQANIGAGTITCNFDGVFKHKTVIGDRAFIGSNSALVAPVRIGHDAMTGSGSVISDDVPDTDLALARAAQVNKPGLALKFMNRLRALKAKKNKDA